MHPGKVSSAQLMQSLVRRNFGGYPVQSVAELRALTVKQLAQIAKCRGIPGWHAMRKEELIKALSKLLKAEQRKRGKSSSNLLTQHSFGVNSNGGKQLLGRKNGSGNGRSSKLKVTGSSKKSLSASQAIPSPSAPPPVPPPDPKDLASGFECSEITADRVVLMVRDPFWLQACWEVTRQTVERARIALGQQWHLAKPVLRLVEIDSDGAETGNRRVVCDIEIHGAVNYWYIPVGEPPRTFQVDLGYYVPGGKFHCLARSNVVTTRPGTSSHWWPQPFSNTGINWDRVLALTARGEFGTEQEDLRDFLEEKLERPVGEGLLGRLGTGGLSTLDETEEAVPLQIDAEVVLYGTTAPGVRVTVRGEPVDVRADGTFVLRYAFPDRRQVFPIVAWSRDGSEQRTILVAVERNTKAMEPIQRDTEY